MTSRDETSARPTLFHVCARYLPTSETFTYDLIRGLDGFDHHVIAASIENLELFPLPRVIVPNPEERAWTLAAEVGARAVVCHFGPQVTMGMPIALVTDRPAVTLFHGYDVSRLLNDKRWVERYRAVFALGMHALCISDAGRRRLLEIGCPPDQVSVIHLGVDMDRFAFTSPSDRWKSGRPKRILLVARLVAKKGVDVALRAMQKLNERGLDLELRVIGDGPERARIENLISEWRVGNVIMLGSLDHERTRAEFRRADLYIQPSVTAESGDQEGIPVSLMEAQASGLPVVSTRHAGIPELVVDGKTGFLLAENDHGGLALAIERIASDRHLADRLAESGRARVESEFNRARQAQKFAAYFAALISDQSRRPSTWLMQRPRSRKRLLVVGSIPTGLLARKLVLLTHRHTGMHIDLLAGRSSAPSLALLPLVDRIHEYDDGRLSLRRVGVETLRRLQATGYDLAIVPYADETGGGFANIRSVATAAGARHRVALTMRDRETPLPAQRCRPRLIGTPSSPSAASTP